MSKKRGKAKKPKAAPVSEDEYARRLARGGSATLELLARFEVQVAADPGRWAEPFGASQQEMLDGIQVLRAEVLAETINAALVGSGV